MKSYQRIAAAVLVLVAVLLGGCASVPMASMEADSRAKTFSVPADKSLIYVYRNEAMGGAVAMTVALNGKLAGQSGPKTYFMFEVEPGTHELSSLAENQSSVKIVTLPGRAYYVWQEVKMGLFQPRTSLQEVDERTGKAGVSECKRAQSSI
jgi:hypothetical protein